MIGETKTIPVDELHLHLRNPRCLFTSSEEDALYELFADQGGNRRSNKLLALARNIAENGLSPTDLIMVKPADNGFTVREGNRRVAAIKCSLNPSAVPEEFKSLRKAFSILASSMPNVITCHVTEDEKEINRLISLKHSGQRGGIGTIPWDSEQRSRFDQILSGKPDKTVSLIDFLIRHFGKESDEARYIAACKKTNLERMFNTREVREKLGFTLNDSSYEYIREDDSLLSLFLKRLSEAKVSEIYYADDRKAFVDLIIAEASGETAIRKLQQQPLPNMEPCTSQEKDEEAKAGRAAIDNTGRAKEDDTSEPEKTAPRPKGHQRNRRTVAPQSGNPLHTEGKAHLDQLHRELKTLVAEETPMACGLVFRALIEQTVDWYLAATHSSESYGRKYSGRIQAACNELTNSGISGIENNDVDYLRKFAQNKDDIPVSLSSLSSIAHGSAGYPDPESLMTLWDKIYLPLRAMLDYGREAFR